VQLVGERARAAREVDPLRDAREVAPPLRIAVRVREIRRELRAARQVAVLPVDVVRALAEVRAGADERHDGAGAEAARDDLQMAAERLRDGHV